ncbi:hypothetical protein HS088_TW17G00860 [Tripterygium wilfordii]|uniref:Pentatricopeptide repeat-containing protein n=1 Tax=Tripterygium wilfordii TaxID=458696 RepID=A0A7J7CGX9_TRIWF|nr:hypothetical protein HS088_TW17G00860 [Tripterygium wilfordii]
MQKRVMSTMQFFDVAPVKDRGIWGAIVSGYVPNNCLKEGLYMFRLMMQSTDIKPDEAMSDAAGKYDDVERLRKVMKAKEWTRHGVAAQFHSMEWSMSLLQLSTGEMRGKPLGSEAGD